MTLRARIFGLFPALWMTGVLSCALVLVMLPSLPALAALGAMVYLLPVGCFRLHDAVWPLAEGRSRIDAPGYAPWWGAHQCQVMYSAFPALEAALRLVPGLYSAWLRLWGSRIGRGVYWTPLVEITDRSLLEIGDGVVFGHRVACFGHLIKRRHDGLLLYVRRIRVGDGAMLGAGSRVGPGASIDPGAVLPLLSDVGVGRRVRKAR